MIDKFDSNGYVNSDYIKKRLEDHISINGIATECNVSSNAIYKAIKKNNLTELFEETREETYSTIKALGRHAGLLFSQLIVEKLQDAIKYRKLNVTLNKQETQFILETMKADGFIPNKEDDKTKILKDLAESGITLNYVIPDNHPDVLND